MTNQSLLLMLVKQILRTGLSEEQSTAWQSFRESYHPKNKSTVANKHSRNVLNTLYKLFKSDNRLLKHPKKYMLH